MCGASSGAAAVATTDLGHRHGHQLAHRLATGLAQWAQADHQLAELTARDLKRHVSYGTEHLRYYLQTHPEKRSEVETWLLRGEVMAAASEE